MAFLSACTSWRHVHNAGFTFITKFPFVRNVHKLSYHTSPLSSRFSLANISVKENNHPNGPQLRLQTHFFHSSSPMHATKGFRFPKSSTPLTLPAVLSVASFANLLQIPTRRILRDLNRLGIKDVFPEYLITYEYSSLLAEEYGFDVQEAAAYSAPSPKSLNSKKDSGPLRPPVVTLMGHVDHGKTTLLDAFRKSTIASTEHGGITQKIGAFTVPFDKGSKFITFLDTPGHMAFEAMRKRGANIADIVVLVVAGDDGVKPQTVEAIKHIQSADVPVVVALTKSDRPGTPIHKIYEQLLNNGIQVEALGGETQIIPISAKTGKGIPELEAAILTLAEIMEIRASPRDPFQGWIVESSVTKGVGSSATVVVKHGTVKKGMYLVAGKSWCKVRSLVDVNKKSIKQVLPGQAAQVYGWKDLPIAGDLAYEVKSESEAKRILSDIYRQSNEQNFYELAESQNEQRVSALAAKKSGPAAIPQEETSVSKSFNIIAKCEDTGSMEALSDYLKPLQFGKIKSRVLYTGVGPVTETDIERAETSDAIIISFGVSVPKATFRLAEKHNVKLLFHNVIYHLMDDVRKLFALRLPPILVQRVTGEAIISAIFDIKAKRAVVHVAGCRVTNGTIEKSHKIRLVRNDKIIWSGEIDSLKHLKEEVTSIKKGRECGILLKNFDEIVTGDKLQTFVEEYKPPDF
ncbi:Translation initiation factor IF-2, mitochondrial [Schizosaccharomyces pombe]